ncbi:MAG: SDR family NAD(P)-dependent oxidoreductase [Phycisphaerales bacterium]
MPAIDLHSKPIAITGASSGIGAATALACARAGMPVALAARRLDRCTSLADRINREGGRAIAVALDVADPEACARLIDRTIDAFGSIYSIYANAGYGIESPADALDPQRLRDIFEVNFFGTMNAIRPALPHFKAARRGHVLICSSCLAKMTLPFTSAYSATKAAQAHIGRAMALELEPLGIHVSVVCPIGTRTEFSTNVRTEVGQPRQIEHIPDRFKQSAELVADATVRCLRRPRPEVWTSLFTRFGMAVCTAFPGIEHFWLRRMVRERAAPADPAPARPVEQP